MTTFTGAERTPLAVGNTADSGWKVLRLGDVCTKIGSGATPRGGKDVYLEHGPYSLIRSQNVYNDGFRHNGLVFVDDQHAEALNNVQVIAGDVLLNITGDSVARVCQVDPSILPGRVNQHVAILRPDPHRLLPRFLRYWLITPATQAVLLSWAGSGGTRKALTKNMIESLEVPGPPLSAQQEIAHVLGTLDNKIELNRRMSSTLGTMVRTLFKSWFVDFDPVRAKMDDRWRPGESLPGLPAHVHDLFPDRLVDSELGYVPYGWEVGLLSDSVEVFNGGTPRTSIGAYWDGDIPWYTGKDAPSKDTVFVLDTERSITQAGVTNSSTQILPGGTTVITARGTVGRLACLGRPMAINQTCYGIRGAAGYPDFFTYWKIVMLLDQFRMRTHGTIFDTITRQTFSLIKTVSIPSSLAEAFERLVSPMMAYNLECLQSIRTLIVTRNALVSKLTSGQLHIVNGTSA